MKRICTIIIFFMSANNLSAQWDLSFSMGLDFKSSPSFRDYINTSFASGNNLIPSFKSAVSFSGEADYKLSNTFAIGLEYDLLILILLRTVLEGFTRSPIICRDQV